MEPDRFYGPGSRYLQERAGTRRLADHLAGRYVLDALEPAHVAWVLAADSVFVSTVAHDGQPEVSYKGGLPGFVQVPDPRTLEIPSFDGNGMFRTLGNARDHGRLGLLFLVEEPRAKLRIHASAEVAMDAPTLARHRGAQVVLRAHVSAVFENCPRYLHDRAAGTHSADCPRPSHTPPTPAWKLKREYEGLIPRPDPR